MAIAADIAHEALKSSEVLGARLNELRTHVDDMELIALRDRVAVLEAVVAELKRSKEESERKRAQYAFYAIGALVTLASSIAVQLFVNWLKK